LFWRCPGCCTPLAGVPILAYHQISDTEDIYCVSPADFERQMSYLARQGYTAVSLASVADYMNGGASLPAKPIAVTFDDGYEDNYLEALPIMEKHGMKASVFVIVANVGQPGYLSWDEIRDMQARGMGIGSHTLSHTALPEVTIAERQREIIDSKVILEQELGQTVEFLSYPYGKFDPATIAILRQGNYRGACSGITGLNRPGGDSYSLKRINILRGKLGFWNFRARLLRASIYAKLGL
jgi:peptidoglycan/xylan/chitin deacetylase (PgdA/CDA1 family)